MKSAKTIILIIILLVIVGGAIYYFGFMRQPDVPVTPTARLDVAVPQLDVGVLQASLFKEMKISAPLPLNIGDVGNTLPFTQINFLSAATTTPSE